jgi:hypothetical protein
MPFPPCADVEELHDHRFTIYGKVATSAQESGFRKHDIDFGQMYVGMLQQKETVNGINETPPIFPL